MVEPDLVLPGTLIQILLHAECMRLFGCDYIAYLSSDPDVMKLKSSLLEEACNDPWCYRRKAEIIKEKYPAFFEHLTN